MQNNYFLRNMPQIKLLKRCHHVANSSDLEIGKTSESSERLALAWFVKLGPRQQHGDVRRFSDYNKGISTIYTLQTKYLVRAEHGATGEKTAPHAAGVRIYRASKRRPISRSELFAT
jgi:hypothetical protein